MSACPSEDPLAGLLATYRPPPPPDGLADRVATRASALPQDPPLGRVARALRDRRGGWVRRPLIAGASALTLAISGAVAATFAGIPLPKPVETVIAELPFVPPPLAPKPVPAIGPEPPQRVAQPRPAAPEPPSSSVPAAPALSSIDERMQRAREIVLARRAAGLRTPRADRIEQAIKTVEARRAAGLPTPHADRIERAIERRRELERQGADPAELDRLQREAIRAEVGRQLLIRRELLRRARAGDPEAIAILQERRRQRQEQRQAWRAEQQQLRQETEPPATDGSEGFQPEPR